MYDLVYEKTAFLLSTPEQEQRFVQAAVERELVLSDAELGRILERELGIRDWDGSSDFELLWRAEVSEHAVLKRFADEVAAEFWAAGDAFEAAGDAFEAAFFEAAFRPAAGSALRLLRDAAARSLVEGLESAEECGREAVLKREHLVSRHAMDIARRLAGDGPRGGGAGAAGGGGRGAGAADAHSLRPRGWLIGDLGPRQAGIFRSAAYAAARHAAVRHAVHEAPSSANGAHAKEAASKVQARGAAHPVARREAVARRVLRSAARLTQLSDQPRVRHVRSACAVPQRRARAARCARARRVPRRQQAEQL